MREIRSVARVAFASLACAVASLPAWSTGDDALARDDIGAAGEEISRIVLDMGGMVTAAERALKDVEEMNIEEARGQADMVFDDMKNEITGMLDALSPNSVLMDNLEGAKANTIVLMRWFERQPPDYPNRDSLIMRLGDQIENYEELGGLIRSGRRDAQDAVRELTRARFYQNMESMVKATEYSVEITRNLVESLQNLGARIRELATDEVPQAIPN